MSEKGQVYRRADLSKWSGAVHRYVATLLGEGLSEKLPRGAYYVPRTTVFGRVPPGELALVRSFLKSGDFLLTFPNAYNSSGVGTAQLYNKRVAYNHQRHGEFLLGGGKVFFQVKHRFPKKITPEFLLVDLLNNLKSLAEDPEVILKNVLSKAGRMDQKKLRQSLKDYASAKAKRLLGFYLNHIE